MDLCINCFEKSSENQKCPNCGYDGEQYEDSALLKRGTVLSGKYLVGKSLGRGGFGITYLGYDLNLHMKVCIKEYFPDSISARQQGTKNIISYSGSAIDNFEYGKEKFVEEGRTLAKFHNEPSIVSVYDFFNENNTAYLVMEYLEGTDLNVYLAAAHDKRLTWDKTKEILFPVLNALSKIHSEGVIHRDVSPDNIFITTDNQVKLLDFGAARQAISEKSQSLSVILKPGYAPFEQYSRNKEQGAWTDIYAVCATIYRCLTGTKPPDSMDRIEDDQIILPSDIVEDIPSFVEDALMVGLNVSYKKRYQSIEELRE